MKIETEKMLNIWLLGKSGSGLSATGNSLLGKQAFKSLYNSGSPTTKKFSSVHKNYGKLKLQVVDGPSASAHHLIKAEDKESLFEHNNSAQEMRFSGYHAFLFVMRFGERFSSEQEEILENLENIFGKSVYDHMIIVMTGGDCFPRAMEQEGGYTNVHEWCSQQKGRFQKLYQDCGERVVLIDNGKKNENKNKQVQDILKLVVKLKVSLGSFKVHVSEKAHSHSKPKVYYSGKKAKTGLVKGFPLKLKAKFVIAYLMLLTEGVHSTVARRHLCHPGTYVHTTRNNKNICQPCPDGTFMPHSLHTHKTYYNCTQIRDHNLEVIKTECSRTRDTEILCTPGYYRRRARNPREQDKCEKCFECEQGKHPIFQCQDYHDTVCCGHTNYDAVLNKDGVYECKERPILCDPGQFLNPETEECTPCPPGTFMSEVQHDETVCRPCKTVSGLGAHETILQACTSTQQANIGCEDGYFRNSSGNLWDEVQCLPCQKCEYQRRECDMYHDTVCCHYPDMIVVNTSSGYQCSHGSGSSTVGFLETDNNKKETNKQECGENIYSCFISEGSFECVPCGGGTNMDKSSHKEVVYKNFSQSNSTHAPGNSHILAEAVDKNATMWVIIVCSFNVAYLIIIIVMLLCIRKLRRHHRNFQRSENKKHLQNYAETAPLAGSNKQSGNSDLIVQLFDHLKQSKDADLKDAVYNYLKQSDNKYMADQLSVKLSNILDTDTMMKLHNLSENEKRKEQLNGAMAIAFVEPYNERE